MEIKLTVALDERTHDTLNRLIDSLSRLCDSDGGKMPEAPQSTPESGEEWTREEIEEVLEAEAKIAAGAKIGSQAEAKTVEEAKPESKAEPVQQAPVVTLEDLRALASDVKAKQGDTSGIKKILNTYGVKTVSSLPESVWGEFAAKLKELL